VRVLVVEQAAARRTRTRGRTCRDALHESLSETGAASVRVLTAANDLTGQSSRLGDEIGGFLEALRKVV
jgi:hypothetical protein